MSDMQSTTIKQAEASAPALEPGSMASATAEIEFVTDLNARVTLHVPLGHVQHYQRYLGRLGWTSTELLRGGLLAPYAIEPDFDWLLLGARKVEFPDETKVFFRGDWYVRRVLEEVKPGRKYREGLPPAVKYSRGAKPSDPPELIEKSGEVELVPLITFKGAGEQFKLHWVTPEARSKYAKR